MTPVELIIKKRDGQEHPSEEIQALITGYLKGDVADYQMSAWLMAAFLRGLSDKETVTLTQAMLRSGDVLELPSVKASKVDKHSTGGVGDKISICLAPLVAACGVAVPMISGRGLGHTGGTLDKLEAIAGYRVDLDTKRFEKTVREVGTSMIGQTEHLAPADRRIYALRDVTGTVECIPLIVASILSKKLAEGIDGLVLDVKVGRGAFMKDIDSARHLAKALVRVGRGAGKQVVALLTDMSAPIGNTIGNSLETREAIEILHGKGPSDTLELTLALGAEMLVLGGACKRTAEGRKLLASAISDGRGRKTFAAMVKAHGGDARVVEEPDRLPASKHRVAVAAEKSGFIHACDPLELGLSALELGAGRKRKEDTIDPAVGIELAKHRGDQIKAGETLCWLHVQRPKDADAISARVRSAYTLKRGAPPSTPLVLERLSK
ncbi:MAG: thymidine phosphorylase [Polyangiaceae bacterium]